MKYHYSLQVAKIIADLVIHFSPEDDNSVISAYSNCREQGFIVRNYEKNRAITFTQHRSSDHIVCCFGEDKDFDNTSNNIINENVWISNKKFFSFNEYTKAADFIVNYITFGNK